jgi:hypothetical protein
MAAVDDLTELVERAAAAEMSALASKWKERSDVEALIRRTRTAAEEQTAGGEPGDGSGPIVAALGGAPAEIPRPGSPSCAARTGTLGRGGPR